MRDDDELPVTARLRDAPDLALHTTDEELLLHRIEQGLRRDHELPPRIARFTVLQELGHGGMGSVVAAYDPRLDRSVAIKRVRVGTGSRARERLLTEAIMMAKLNHPNIVTVFEVVEEGLELFIVMELVRGSTLRAWAAQPHSAADKAAVLVAAGRGLAHAHACGLIHRDFKPDNVLVDEHGVAKVGDFGLAHPSPDRLDGDELAGAAAAGLATSWGHAATPAYAAPELFEDGELGTAVDQFAFCVTAFELFVGRRPWPGTALDADAATRERAAAELRASGCPPHAVEAIVRGLHADARQRWPDLAPLLEALDPRPRRSWWLTLAGLGLVMGLGAWGLLMPSDPCPELDALAESWSDAVRRGVREGVGPEIWPRLERRTQAFVERWAASHRDNCLALHVRAEQSDAAFDRRARCLELTRAELDERLSLLSRGDASLLERWQELAPDAASIEICDDAEALASRYVVFADPRLRAESEAHQEALARIDVLTGVRGYSPDELEPILRWAREHDDPFMEGRALIYSVAAGGLSTSEQRERVELANAAFVRAGDREDTMRTAAILGVGLVDAGRPAEALPWVRRADAAVDERPPGRWSAWAITQSYLAVVEAANGRADAALARLDRVHAARAPSDEVSPVEHYTLLNTRARVLDAAGRPRDSLPLHEQAAAAAVAALGPQHPAAAQMRDNVATLRWSLGDREASLELAREIIADAPEPGAGGDAQRRCSLAGRLREVGRMQEAQQVLAPVLASDAALEQMEPPCLLIAGFGLAIAGRRPEAAHLRELLEPRRASLRDPQLRYWWDLLEVLLREPDDPEAAAASLQRMSEVGRWLFPDEPSLTHWAPSLLARNRWRAGDCAGVERATAPVLEALEGPLDLSQTRCAFVRARCSAAAGDEAGAMRWQAVTARGLAELEVASAPAQDPLGPWLEPDPGTDEKSSSPRNPAPGPATLPRHDDDP